MIKLTAPPEKIRRLAISHAKIGDTFTSLKRTRDKKVKEEPLGENTKPKPTKKQSNDNQKIIELLEDISRDLMNYDLEFRIQELESKFSVDMSETTFNELKELKKKQNLN